MNIQTRTMEREAIEALERDPEPEPPAAPPQRERKEVHADEEG